MSKTEPSNMDERLASLREDFDLYQSTDMELFWLTVARAHLKAAWAAGHNAGVLSAALELADVQRDRDALLAALKLARAAIDRVSEAMRVGP